MMLLQTFSNPVWTIGEVAAMYGLIVIGVVFLGYHLFDSIIESVSDIKKLVRKYYSKF